jgi:DNA (cytosine-5)-methyltransferase 1
LNSNGAKLRESSAFRRIKKFIPNGWEQELKEFPPSLRKLEWNCKGETRDLWDHILQFRSSGLRVKRYQDSPSLVAMFRVQLFTGCYTRLLNGASRKISW